MPGCFSALENQIIIYLLNSDTMVESTVHTESNTLILIKPLNSSGTNPERAVGWHSRSGSTRQHWACAQAVLSDFTRPLQQSVRQVPSASMHQDQAVLGGGVCVYETSRALSS